jgi:SAM-dependent methyltransferase
MKPASRDRRAVAAAIAAFAFAPPILVSPRRAWAQAEPKLDVPYVPTPQPIVDRMLQMARVRKDDELYDLGCGDGRIVISAARKYGARGTGIDINPVRIDEARQNARSAGVENRVEFKVGNLFESDFSQASVVTLYLLPDINKRLRPQLWKQLKVGTRVVSHAFDMGDEWPPERTEHAEGRSLYAWTIRAEHKKAV